jgi:hypothetical protein
MTHTNLFVGHLHVIAAVVLTIVIEAKTEVHDGLPNVAVAHMTLIEAVTARLLVNATAHRVITAAGVETVTTMIATATAAATEITRINLTKKTSILDQTVVIVTATAPLVDTPQIHHQQKPLLPPLKLLFP